MTGNAPDETDREPTTSERAVPEPSALRSMGRGRLIAIAVSALIVAVAGVLAVRSIPTADTSPDSAPVPVHASFAAARMWFDPPFTASDSFPHSDVLQSNGIDSRDVRFALAGVAGGNVWVARTDDQLCLLFADAADAADAPKARADASCVPFERFEGGGIHLRVDNVEVYWGGGPVITDPPTVDDQVVD